jgi:hypothetical protein
MFIQRLLTLAFVLGSVLPAAKADTMTFPSSSSLIAQLGAHITDDYSNPGYATAAGVNIGDTAVLTDAQMTAVLGETTYTATGFPDFNLVSPAGTSFATYCTGCNGSFELGFTSTSVGSSNGVFGAGFDVVIVSPNEYAFVTFGDGSTANYLLKTGTYFGITSTLGIKTIDVGLINGGITTTNFAEIDNLTIGGPPVPEPAGWLLLATVTGMVALLCRNRVPALK